jgi:hypothetical protein
VGLVAARVYMLIYDVLPASWPPAIRVALRIWIFPHHVLLFWWLSLYTKEESRRVAS